MACGTWPSLELSLHMLHTACLDQQANSVLSSVLRVTDTSYFDPVHYPSALLIYVPVSFSELKLEFLFALFSVRGCSFVCRETSSSYLSVSLEGVHGEPSPEILINWQ